MKEFSNNLEIKRTVLEPFEVEGRTIYPVVDVLNLTAGLRLLNISPVALIIEENENKYIFQLNYREIDEDELFDLFSSFKNRKEIQLK